MKSPHHLSTPTTTSNIKTKIKNKNPQKAWKPIHTKKETIRPHNHLQLEKKTDPENKEQHNHTTLTNMKQQRTTPKKLKKSDPAT
jgi:hypothetical protein